jgi:cobalamin biosynthetic protein CobC
MTEQIRHGGNLAGAIAQYGGVRSQWLDLSTGISPWAYPVGNVPMEGWARLPEADAEANLINAAKAAYGVPANAQVVAAPGTQALIQRLPDLPLQKATVALDPVGYQEHAVCWQRAGHDVVLTRAPLVEAIENTAITHCVVIHPHNPLGHFQDLQALSQVAELLPKRGGFLVVDEAFCDAYPLRSTTQLSEQGALILKSFGKIFGLAGLRLGFAIGPGEPMGQLKAELGPWAVSGPAMEIGAKALVDDVWLKNHVHKLIAQSAALSELLSENGFSPAGSTSLFVSVRHQKAGVIADGLARQHILIRGFDQDAELLRFGLPGTADDMLRLQTALAEVLA